MGAVASLSLAELVVEPGEEVTCEITVRNTGTVVDQFGFVPVGIDAAWVTVEPATVSLFPGTSETALLRIHPPRSPDVAAHTLPFAIQVTSSEDPAGTVVEEGRLTIGGYAELAAELAPRTSRPHGRRWGKHEVAIDCRSNVATAVELAGVDLDNAVEIRFSRHQLVVEPGTATFVGVRVRSRRTYWKGPPVNKPFQMVVRPADAANPIVLDGVLLQQALIPKWLPKVLLALLGLVALAAALWFLLLKPVVKSAAKDAAATTAKQAASTAAKQAAAPAVAAAKQAATSAAAVAAGSPAPSPSPAPAGAGAAASLGDPFTTRLAASSKDQSPSVGFGQKTTFSLTDFVLQNPAGDHGLLSVLRANETLFTSRLDNFRDLDEHFVAPWVFTPGQRLTLRVTCQNPPGEPACTPSITVGGFTKVTPSPGPAAKG